MSVLQYTYSKVYLGISKGVLYDVLYSVVPIKVHYIMLCIERTTGGNTPFTLTFNKGGATDFARTFFQLTEGKPLYTRLATRSIYIQ